MAEKYIQMSQRNTANTGWDDLFPKTKAEQVVASDGTTVATHMADLTSHVYYADDTGTANAKVLTIPGIISYKKGLGIAFTNLVANTGIDGTTININGLGAKPIFKLTGNAPVAGFFRIGFVYTLRYNGSFFFLQGEGGEYGNAIAADVLIGKTFGTENGIVSGTLQKGKQVHIVDFYSDGTSRAISFPFTFDVVRVSGRVNWMYLKDINGNFTNFGLGSPSPSFSNVTTNSFTFNPNTTGTYRVTVYEQ